RAGSSGTASGRRADGRAAGTSRGRWAGDRRRGERHARDPRRARRGDRDEARAPRRPAGHRRACARGGPAAPRGGRRSCSHLLVARLAWRRLRSYAVRMALTENRDVPLGTPCPDFRLPTVDGKTVARDDLRATPVLAVMFICNHCPYVQAVEDRLVALA